MRTLLGVYFAASLCAQPQAPRGVLRGELIERTGGQQAGDMVVRASDERSFKCAYDGHTYVERDSLRITMAATRKGDNLEVIADHKLGPGLCYARTVRIVELRPTIANPGYRTQLRPLRTIEHIYPRGSITFAGVVLRRNDEMMIIRPRYGDERMVMLRQDTRYLDSGFSAESTAVRPNLRVFIRGGKNLSGELEAYQVVWGEIAGPKSY
jgi:hypothetical protein